MLIIIYHIIDRHGSIVTKYVKFIDETLQHPNAFGNSKKYPDVKIYASKNTKEKNYPTSYLIIVVNEVNNITTMYFSKNINMIRKQFITVAELRESYPQLWKEFLENSGFEKVKELEKTSPIKIRFPKDIFSELSV